MLHSRRGLRHDLSILDECQTTGDMFPISPCIMLSGPKAIKAPWVLPPSHRFWLAAIYPSVHGTFSPGEGKHVCEAHDPSRLWCDAATGWL